MNDNTEKHNDMSKCYPDILSLKDVWLWTMPASLSINILFSFDYKLMEYRVLENCYVIPVLKAIANAYVDISAVLLFCVDLAWILMPDFAGSRSSKRVRQA
jgi:hypothetical protein